MHNTKLNTDDSLDYYCDWVKMIALSYIRKRNIPPVRLEELISAGMLGLLESLKRFDKSREANFKQFAFLRIRGAMIDALRESSLMSVMAQRHFKSMSEESSSHNYKPKIVKQGGYGILGQASEFSDRVNFCEQKEELYPDSIVERKELLEILRSCLKELSGEEIKFVKDHYFKDKSLAQISRENNKTCRSWATRRHEKVLAKIRSKYDAATQGALA